MSKGTAFNPCFLHDGICRVCADCGRHTDPEVTLTHRTEEDWEGVYSLTCECGA